MIELVINGKNEASASSGTFGVINPLTGQELYSCADADATDCKRAIDAADAAFADWSQWAPSKRRDLFLRAAELLGSDRYVTKIRKHMVEETGAAQGWVHPVNTHGGVQNLRETAALATQIKGEIISTDLPGTTVLVVREACGVVFAISPWNGPIVLALRAVATPLVCGNTVLLKPSEFAPATQRIVVECLMEAGLPPGALNYLPMSAKNAAVNTELIIADRRVRRVNFTGSDRVGRIIGSLAGKYIKPVILELGGKAAAVVLEDADLDAAADKIVFAALMHSGQICMSTERVVAHTKIADALSEKIATRMRKLRAGDQANDGAQLSCLFTEQSATRVVDMISRAVQEGGKAIVGDLKANKAIVQPHLIDFCPTTSDLYIQESFGPVIAMVRGGSNKELVDLVNSSEYTLSNAVYGTSIEGLMQVARQIKSGSVHLNGPTVSVETNRPAGGFGGPSGYGRFGGLSGVDEYTDKKIITINPIKAAKLPLVS